MLREYAKVHTEMSFKEIGRAFGISGSRAYRIINGNQRKKRLEILSEVVASAYE